MRHIPDTLTRNLLKIAFAISLFTAFQFAYEIGRLDLLNIIILVIALYLVHKRRWVSVLLLTIAGMLIHEAFAFFCAPLIMASLWLAKDDTTSDHWLSKQIYIAIYSCTVAITSLLIVKFGNNPLVLTLSPGVGQEAWNRPLVQHALTRLSPIDLMLTAMVVSYSYIWLVSFYRSNNGRLDAWFIAAFAPLMLFVVGWDYARWSGLIFVVVLIVIAVKAITEGWVLGLRNMRFGAAFLLLPLGPIGSE
jgi:hypothetical protein